MGEADDVAVGADHAVVVFFAGDGFGAGGAGKFREFVPGRHADVKGVGTKRAGELGDGDHRLFSGFRSFGAGGASG